MTFTPAPLAGVFVIEPSVHADARGRFVETYRKDLFAAHGVTAEFVQDNQSTSAKGVLRGLHYQAAPHAQAKLVRVARGSAFDAVVDLRRGSPTFGRAFTQTLSAENGRMLYVPEGFAHGFLSLEDGTEFLYKVTALYSPGHERGVRWDDPALGIRWPRLDRPPSVSPKDAALPPLAGAEL